MAPITHDPQCFTIGGRRRWLVSGTIDPARTPRALWAERVRAAKQAGLNCVTVPVVWSRHEAIPGTFNFTGENDVASFVRLIGEQGMLCILRPGPFVGGGWDAGGLPSWLATKTGGESRSGAPAFLESASRWIEALMRHVRDLQAVATAKRGPIALIQSEHEWFCGDDAVGEAYLGELSRFFRECGAKVPLVNCNNLYQSPEGEIDCWTGRDGLYAHLRQLGEVRPEAPRVALELPLGRSTAWGESVPAPALTPMQALHRLAQALAAGAQFNIGPFHGGTLWGFGAGRAPGAPDAFLTSGQGAQGPLGEAGERGAMYGAVKRVCTFASQFERVFCGLDPTFRPIVADPAGLNHAAEARRGAPGAPSVVHCRGAQGSVAFVFGDDAPEAKNGVVPLTLPDGSGVQVDLRGQPAVWCLFDAILSPKATLEVCTLSAFASVGDVFVCYGPPGAHGLLSINGSAFEVVTPSGKRPTIEKHEGVTVVVCNEEQIDAAYATDDAVHIGAWGIDAAGAPIAHPGVKPCVTIGRDGVEAKTRVMSAASAPGGGKGEALGDWSLAVAAGYVDGTSERFATIGAPEAMDRLGAASGYGWLRLRVKSSAGKRGKACVFDAGDRLHFFAEGKHLTTFGVGPAASAESFALALKKGENTLTILMDNMGRPCEGFGLLERKGMWGPLWMVSPLAAGRATLEVEAPLRPLDAQSPLWRVHGDERTNPKRITWSFMHRRKSPVAMSIGSSPARGLLVVNGQPAGWVEPGSWVRLLLSGERLKQGKNTVQIAVLGDAEEALRRLSAEAHFYECKASLSEGGEWAFARWEPPAAGMYVEATKTALERPSGLPTWWRGRFALEHVDGARFLDVSGMSKGQAYLNGHNLGRYWVSTPTNARVGPQTRLYLPEPWLLAGKRNEVLLFDEHGSTPRKCAIARSGE